MDGGMQTSDGLGDLKSNFCHVQEDFCCNYLSMTMNKLNSGLRFTPIKLKMFDHEEYSGIFVVATQ